jgi:sRNA-binding regulator protein Hfq
VAGTSKTKAPEQTFEEVRYLRHLSENQIRVRARLTDNSEVQGTIEFYDVDFIRLTREGEPNLFLYKHDIKYLYEVDSSETRTTERVGSISETKEGTPPRPVR